jgi:hypothetical protein
MPSSVGVEAPEVQSIGSGKTSRRRPAFGSLETLRHALRTSWYSSSSRLRVLGEIMPASLPPVVSTSPTWRAMRSVSGTWA